MPVMTQYVKKYIWFDNIYLQKSHVIVLCCGFLVMIYTFVWSFLIFYGFFADTENRTIARSYSCDNASNVSMKGSGKLNLQ